MKEGIDAPDIADRLQTDFGYSLLNMLINFERFNSGLERHGSVVKISTMTFALEDILWMIMMPKFWLDSTHLLSNELVQ
jgi:hypothetical protein